MNVLVLGSGAREHALVWRISQSPVVKTLVAAPGNPGIAALADCAPLDPTNPAAVVALAQARKVELVVVGPEAPLVAGVADALRAAGFAVFGPDQAAARIEGSKAFAKEIMQAAHVPTARSERFDDVEAAARRAREWGPVVVKADGLAGGKGVVVASSGEEAAQAVRSVARLPGGKRLLLEERLEGPEVSVMALCDGERFVLLPDSCDHKRLSDGDQGPNTGGMGAYAPGGLFDGPALADIGRQVIAPTLHELKRRGTPFRGALYAGLMLTRRGPMVLEYNCRLGDPETQPLMMQLDEDLLPLLDACARGTLVERPLKLRDGVSVGVVLAASGYPEAPRLGDVIRQVGAPAPGVQRFHAGTRRQGADLVTAGGRVMTVCAQGATREEARLRAYADAERVEFAGRHFRYDIGARSST